MSSQTSSNTDSVAQESAAAIEVSGLTKRYRDGDVLALDNVSLSIEHGEYVAIVGPSGSGKSTLLNMIGCLDKPDEGHLSIDGRKVDARTDLNELRARKFGFVFQAFHLIPTLTALDNVVMPMLELQMTAATRSSRARALLSKVNLEHRIKHLPSMLSIGERQRVAIARALANEPPILLADEPTGSLDSGNSQDILRLFEDLRADRKFTLIVITHSHEVAQHADRQIEVLDGKIAVAQS